MSRPKRHLRIRVTDVNDATVYDVCLHNIPNSQAMSNIRVYDPTMPNEPPHALTMTSCDCACI